MPYSDEIKDRQLGALLGVAVGDALGAPLEFSKPKDAYQILLGTKPPVHTEMKAGGPFSLEAGQITDDTMMAVALARSLSGGKWSEQEAGVNYVDWLNTTFDCGNQTRRSLGAIRNSESAERAGYDTWAAGGRRASGNGGLMRAAPIGVFCEHLPVAIEIAVRDVMITHADPRCMFSNAVYCALINRIVYDAAVKTENGVILISNEVDNDVIGTIDYVSGDMFPRLQAMGYDYTQKEIDDARVGCLEDVRASLQDDPGLNQDPSLNIHTTQGFVRVGFRLAMWAFMHPEEGFEKMMTRIVGAGGDSDTNGAICGGMLGAMFGASGLPLRWKEAVLGALQDGPPSKLRDSYHPKVFAPLLQKHFGNKQEA